MGTPLVFLGGRVEDPDDDPAFSGSVYSQPEAKGLQDAGPVVQDQLSVLLVWADVLNPSAIDFEALSMKLWKAQEIRKHIRKLDF